MTAKDVLDQFVTDDQVLAVELVAKASQQPEHERRRSLQIRDGLHVELAL